MRRGIFKGAMPGEPPGWIAPSCGGYRSSACAAEDHRFGPLRPAGSTRTRRRWAGALSRAVREGKFYLAPYDAENDGVEVYGAGEPYQNWCEL